MAATTAAAAASAGATINVGPTDEQFNEEDDVMSPAKEKATKKKYAPGRKKVSRNKLPFEEVQIYFDELLDDAAVAECCKKKTGGGTMKCTCLHLLCDPKLREPVARFMATMDRTTKSVVDQKILDWYRYAENVPGLNRYLMPYDGTVSYEIGDDLSALKSATMCTSGMFTMESAVRTMGLGLSNPIN